MWWAQVDATTIVSASIELDWRWWERCCSSTAAMLTVGQLVVLDWGANNAEEIVDLLFDVAMSSDESATMIASTSNSKMV